MIGILIITENETSKEQLKSVVRLLGEQPHCRAVVLSSELSQDDMLRIVQDNIKLLKSDEILVFHDLWGSTQARVCQTFLKEGHVELISGYNFPMLLKSMTLRQSTKSFEDFLKSLVQYGVKHIWHIQDSKTHPKS